jgi:hypothetical protein
MKRIIFLFAFLLVAFCLNAQREDSVSNLEDEIGNYDSTSTEEVSYDTTERAYSPEQLNEAKAYRKETLQPKEFDQKKWKEIVGNTNYDDNLKKDAKEEKKDEKQSQETFSPVNPWNSDVLRFVAYLLVISLVLFIIYSIVKNVSFKYSPRRSSSRLVDPTIPVENIEELNVPSMLAQALAEGNYKLAVRLYYLALLQKLNEAGSIIWQKEKTNRDYLSELVQREYYHDVRSLTHAYEQVWYGEHIVSELTFRRLSGSFEELNQKLNSSKQQ